MALVARTKQQADRVRNRLEMPISAAFIDAFTEVFGKSPRGRFTENGRTVQWGKW